MCKKTFTKIKESLSRVKWLPVAVCAGIFVALCFFFMYAHPMYIYDTDDWMYAARSRLGIPIPGYWNPTRVLPEVLMPLAAEMGIGLIMPFTGDYFGSIEIACALFLCIPATIYIVMLANFAKREFKLGNAVASGIMVFAAILQFMPFYTEYFKHAHMFYANNVTCVFFYVISGIVNAILMFILWKNEHIKWSDKEHLIRHGLLILLIFLALNSNLFQSIVSMAFVGCILTERLCGALFKDRETKLILRVKDFVKTNLDYLAMLVCWFGVLSLEGTGGRAELGKENLFAEIPQTLKFFKQACRHMHVFFLAAVAGSIVFALVVYILTRTVKKENSDKEKTFMKNFLRQIFCLVLTFVFIILLCAKVNPGYIKLTSVLWGIVFYVMLIMMNCIGYCLSKIPYLAFAIPLILFVLCSEFVVTRDDYGDIYDWPETIKQIDEDILSQVLDAYERGEKEIVVHVPDCGAPYWPFDTVGSGGEKIATTLYRHGFTDEILKITLVPDTAINEKYNYS
ncbi:MAG: hypothetical protein MJ119_03330 [Lachnospiraceae bacterium]|nr:hypothetical protein [Lachnospiraceae bacterium]